MNPDGAHDDIGLAHSRVTQRLSVCPDMKRQIRGCDGKVGGIKKWQGIDEGASNSYRDQEGCEDMPGSISPVTGQSSPEKVRRWKNGGLGRPCRRSFVNTCCLGEEWSLQRRYRTGELTL